MADFLERSELVLGNDVLEILSRSTVAVFGIGGVGSYTAEALARSGIGRMVLIDNDCVCVSNINRQLIAFHSTLGRPKVDVMRERILDINPQARVEAIRDWYDADSSERLLRSEYSCIADAIDSIPSKIDLIVRAQAMGIPIISSMGAGNKKDPSRFELADIYNTSVCPLAKRMRYELRKRKIRKLRVVYSRETPVKPDYGSLTPEPGQANPPGSLAYVPAVAGLVMASGIIQALVSGADMPDDTNSSMPPV